MSILKEYTLDYIRHNKKSSASIMIAILIATTLLSALSGFLYTMYADEIRLTLLETGNWHTELFDITTGDKLKYVTGHPNVEAVMIKGTWETARINDPRRPYLSMRNLTANYWKDMPEHAAIIEGRIPKSKNELAISKQYFENHPDLKMGDSISFSIGNRTINGKALEFSAALKENEVFAPTEKRTYTVVGKLDFATNSITPAYVAYGYMEESDIRVEDQLTVYMRFKNPRTAYSDIEQIAQSVGYKPDEYGNYMVRVNSDLLSKYFIFPPVRMQKFNISRLSQPLMFISFGLLTAAMFVLIINNAFAMSANSRLKQLGILQSIGASPKQIRHSIVYESLVLSVIPIPIGLFIGWVLDYSMFSYLNSMETMRDVKIIFTFGLPAVLPSVLLALLTVWLSALLPARKISRLSPIEAIRQGGDIRIRELKGGRFVAWAFGLEGELAENALYARRKSYRTAAISLTLSFMLLSTFLTFLAVNDTANILFNDDKYKGKYDLMLNTWDGNLTDPEFEKDARSIEGLKSLSFMNDVPASLWLSADMQSEELLSIGGLSRIADSSKYYVYEDKGLFRIQTQLLTMDDKSFAEYCKQIGADASMFYSTNIPRTIVINQAKDDINSNRRNDIRIPFLKLNIGDKLSCEEKVYDEDTSQYVFQTETGFITNQAPPVVDLLYKNFQLLQIMPRSEYMNIINNFEEKRALNARNVFAPILVESEDLIQPAADKLQEISGNWYGSGDYYIRNTLEVRRTNENGLRLIKAIALCISVFLALIGISNVFSTVSGNLRQRQKEFAMLRSVGLSPKGITRMLMLEALFLGLLPILLSIPLNFILAGILLKINMIYISEFLPYLPALPIAVFGAVILLSVMIAYALGGKQLQSGAIVDILKDESV